MTDAYSLQQATAALTQHLMTPLAVDPAGPGQLRLTSPAAATSAHRPVLLEFDPDSFVGAVEAIDLDDERLRQVWGDRLSRIVLRTKQPVRQGRSTLRLSVQP